MQKALQLSVAIAEYQRRLSSIKVQRLRTLEGNYPGITNLASWLETPEARNMFKGKVYGPLLCEVTVDRPQNAAYLEQHCPRELPASVSRQKKFCVFPKAMQALR